MATLMNSKTIQRGLDSHPYSPTIKPVQVIMVVPHPADVSVGFVGLGRLQGSSESSNTQGHIVDGPTNTTSAVQDACRTPIGR